jgi:hypothetical protein
MYDPDTVELALEMGLDPEDFGMGSGVRFSGYSGAAFRQQNQQSSQYDFQDDIGDYMHPILRLVFVHLKTSTRKLYFLLSRTSCSISDSPIFSTTACIPK